jgi:DoxX-like family
MMKMKVIGYWTATAAVASVLLVDGVMGLVHAHGRVMLIGKPLDEVMQRLGYPAYLLKILGVWKPLGAIALLVPGFPRLKEWAYAGAFFNMTGAATSSVASGDDVGNSIWALIFAVLTLASWALRPQSRTLGVLFPASDGSATNAR